MAPTGGRVRGAGMFPELRWIERRAGLEPKAPTVTFRATPKQVEFMNVVRDGRFRFCAIGGGIRGTKTIACLAVLVVMCRMFPRSRWAIVRTDLPTLRRNIVPSMEKIRLWSGGFVGALNQSTWTYTCANGSELILFAEQATQDPELERFKGLEVNGFLGEEASELQEKTAVKMIERAGSYIIPALPNEPEPRQPPPLLLFNFNPCKEWPRAWFYEPWKNGTLAAPYSFTPATIADNPFASEEYKASLKFMPPEEYARFVQGEWDFVDDPRQLIKTEWLWRARNIDFVDGPVRIGADVARYGDDHTSITKVRGNALRKLIHMNHFDNVEVATALLNEANGAPEPVASGDDVRVDVVGLGSGVVDYCRLKKLHVTSVIAGAKPIPRPGAFFQFKDLRSQMWWEAREKFRTGQLQLFLTNTKGEEVTLPPKLLQDLTAIKYEISGDKVISVEPKEGTSTDWGLKNRLGRSPDDGDAYVMAVFDFPPAPRRPILPGSVTIVGH